RALLLALLAAGCYHPDIGDGQYTCGAGDARCPTGFVCDPCARCVRPGRECNANPDGGGDMPACVPTTCDLERKNCGEISDGCGGMLKCGSCAVPNVCGGGGKMNVCGCTPTD